MRKVAAIGIVVVLVIVAFMAGVGISTIAAPLLPPKTITLVQASTHTSEVTRVVFSTVTQTTQASTTMNATKVILVKNGESVYTIVAGMGLAYVCSTTSTYYLMNNASGTLNVRVATTLTTTTNMDCTISTQSANFSDTITIIL
jgi:hypothetical protein